MYCVCVCAHFQSAVILGDLVLSLRYSSSRFIYIFFLPSFSLNFTFHSIAISFSLVFYHSHNETVIDFSIHFVNDDCVLHSHSSFVFTDYFSSAILGYWVLESISRNANATFLRISIYVWKIYMKMIISDTNLSVAQSVWLTVEWARICDLRFSKINLWSKTIKKLNHRHN